MLMIYSLRLLLPLAAAMQLAACATVMGSKPVVIAEPTQPMGLHPQAERITDHAIADDLKYIASLRQRLSVLNDNGHPIDEYHFCKAQAWTDMAYEEYTNNDRSGVVDAAAAQANFLIEHMEAQDLKIPTDTPIIHDSKKVRNDLWSFAEQQKQHGLVEKVCSSACALAKMEVQTVWAGHNELELGWRYAESPIHAAERLRNQVQTELNQCDPVPVVVAAPIVCDVPKAQISPTISKVEVPDVVYFALNQYTLSRSSRAVLDQVANVLREQAQGKVLLSGYTDIRANPQYNKALAQHRVDAVRDYLVNKGINRTRIDTRAIGQNVQSASDLKRSFALSRRVTLAYDGLENTDLKNQQSDLQIEADKSQQGQPQLSHKD